MNRNTRTYTILGLVTSTAATSLVLLLAFKPFTQPSQASPAPILMGQSMPPMWGMMGQPDQHFIIMMIPHHEGAIAMADLALERSQRPEIIALAEAIKETQSAEIAQMQQWYQEWYDEDVPDWAPGIGQNDWDEDDVPSFGMHHHWGRDKQWQNPSRRQSGAPCMSTMFGDTTALEDASDFDRAFIEEMIPHHQMGVRMAQMVLYSSDRPEIQELAQTIIDTQTAEIEQMQQWYAEWYP